MRHPRVEMGLFFGSQGPVSELTISHGVPNLFFFFFSLQDSVTYKESQKIYTLVPAMHPPSG